MNWRLVLLLSMLGLAMAFARVYVLPLRLEGACWLAIFAIDAFVIARRAPGRFFLHGFLVGLANWMWIAAGRVLLYDAYAARHAGEMAALQAMALPRVPATLAPIVAAFRRYELPIPGASGVVIGALSWLASKILRSRREARPAPRAFN